MKPVCQQQGVVHCIKCNTSRGGFSVHACLLTTGPELNPFSFNLIIPNFGAAVTGGNRTGRYVCICVCVCAHVLSSMCAIWIFIHLLYFIMDKMQMLIHIIMQTTEMCTLPNKCLKHPYVLSDYKNLASSYGKNCNERGMGRCWDS